MEAGGGHEPGTGVQALAQEFMGTAEGWLLMQGIVPQEHPSEHCPEDALL